MKDAVKRVGPGRPLEHGAPLERVQVLVTRELRREAEKQASKRGVSISQVYRDWMEAGK